MQPIQRQERNATPTRAFEVVDGDRGVVPGFRDDVLKRAAQRRLDGLVVFRRHADQRCHRADNAGEVFVIASGTTGLQDRSHAAGIAGAFVLQPLQ